MLVLSRRQNEIVDFPGMNVSVEVLRIAGSSVQLGINAPSNVRILRRELADLQQPFAKRGEPHQAPNGRIESRDWLDAVTMGLQLVRHQLNTGRRDDAEQTVDHLISLLQSKQAPIVQKPSHKVQTSQGTPRRALIVEDDANERILLAGYLRSQGFEVMTAEDGVEALEHLSHSEPPDFVLLDMRMPRMDGPSTLAKIRSTPRCKGLRVFGVSGADADDCGVPIGPSGVDSWFLKPLDPAKIIAEVGLTNHTQSA